MGPTTAAAGSVTPARLSLAPIGGAPFSLDASLDTVGVVDGDLLALQPIPAGSAAPGIVEDIADAAVIFSTSRLKPWGIGHIQRGALAAVVGLVWAATGLAVTHRVVTGAPAGLFAVGAIAVLAARGRLGIPFTARGRGVLGGRAGAHRRGVGVGGTGQLWRGAGDAGRRRGHRVVADQPDPSSARKWKSYRGFHRDGGARAWVCCWPPAPSRYGSCRW